MAEGRRIVEGAVQTTIRLDRARDQRSDLPGLGDVRADKQPFTAFFLQEADRFKTFLTDVSDHNWRAKTNAVAQPIPALPPGIRTTFPAKSRRVAGMVSSFPRSSLWIGGGLASPLFAQACAFSGSTVSLGHYLNHPS
jgi:hypothetical protein